MVILPVMSLRIDVISIGTLSRNRLWGETQVIRTAHATTTLIRAGKELILVDPGLPGQILAARLQERTGVQPDQITTVFLTNFRPAHRAGLAVFDKARRLISEVEQQWAHQQISQLIEQAPEQDLDRKVMEDELAVLETFKPAEDALARGVDLFPLPGYTPGGCGLLVAMPALTALISGDAVPTQDHFLAGQVLPDAQDLKQAQESMAEVYEIADIIIPGHDNLFLNPRSQGI
jgi:glyoxylase-like metal-dependent hydrolase (beta-lactamase superfamily II)